PISIALSRDIKQLIYNQSQAANKESNDFVGSAMNLNVGKSSRPTNKVDIVSDAKANALLKDNKRAYEHELIMRDYDMVISLSPGFVYAYFNRANLRCAQRDFRAAIVDYDEAIERDPEFAEAYSIEAWHVWPWEMPTGA
ncbi:TPR repeat-containing protein, partial [gut metagenome]